MARNNVELVSPPNVSPVSLEEVKRHLNLNHDNDDDLLLGFIDIATSAVEEYTGRYFIRRTVSESFSRPHFIYPEDLLDDHHYGGSYGLGSLSQFRSYGRPTGNPYRNPFLPVRDEFLELSKSPVASVVSVKYFDEDNVEHTWDTENYIVDLNRTYSRLSPSRDQQWPDNLREYDAIRIEYVVGESENKGDIAPAIGVAMRIYIASLYENRGDTNMMPKLPEQILFPFVLSTRNIPTITGRH